MVSALEWAEIRTLARDGVSQRQIARRLGIQPADGREGVGVGRAAAVCAGAGGVAAWTR